MIKKYKHFLLLEKFDDNIKAELLRMGVTDEKESGQIDTALDIPQNTKIQVAIEISPITN